MDGRLPTIQGPAHVHGKGKSLNCNKSFHNRNLFIFCFRNACSLLSGLCCLPRTPASLSLLTIKLDSGGLASQVFMILFKANCFLFLNTALLRQEHRHRVWELGQKIEGNKNQKKRTALSPGPLAVWPAVCPTLPTVPSCLVQSFCPNHLLSRPAPCPNWNLSPTRVCLAATAAPLVTCLYPPITHHYLPALFPSVAHATKTYAHPNSSVACQHPSILPSPLVILLQPPVNQHQTRLDSLDPCRTGWASSSLPLNIFGPDSKEIQREETIESGLFATPYACLYPNSDPIVSPTQQKSIVSKSLRIGRVIKV